MKKYNIYLVGGHSITDAELAGEGYEILKNNIGENAVLDINVKGKQVVTNLKHVILIQEV